MLFLPAATCRCCLLFCVAGVGDDRWMNVSMSCVSDGLIHKSSAVLPA